MVGPPWYKQESFWLAIAAGCSAAPTVIEPFLPLLPEQWRQLLLAVGVALAAMSARFARKPGAEARERVAVVEEARAQESEGEA
jgi:hypothetical protein